VAGPDTRWRLLRALVLAVAAHSVIIGVALLSFPVWALKVAGWDYTGEVFWPSQAGLFLIILGVAYGAAVRFPPLVWLLIGSKACAFVFLMAHTILLGGARALPSMGAADGLMCLSVSAALWYSRRGARADLA